MRGDRAELGDELPVGDPLGEPDLRRGGAVRVYVRERPLRRLHDLLFAALDPTATALHQALVRLEDVNPTSDPTSLEDYANYLYARHIPFSVGVVPEYTDPKGYYNGGKAQTITLAQAPKVVAALKYMQSHGGEIIEHGYTHQYSNVANPYDGVSTDDAEFYRAQCSKTQTPPYSFESTCQNSDWVIWTGPLPGDSSLWAAGRVLTGQLLFALAGLQVPAIWETPHYAASAVDYKAIDAIDHIRYEREIFPYGLLGGTLNYSEMFGQFFPYTVTDVYGEKIIPENLGNYEPTPINNNAARLPADIINNAKANLAVTQGVASFFFHPAEDPTPATSSPFGQTIAGIQALGYTFVAPTAVAGGSERPRNCSRGRDRGRAMAGSLPRQRSQPCSRSRRRPHPPRTAPGRADRHPRRCGHSPVRCSA